MCDFKSPDIKKLEWTQYSSTLYTAQLQYYQNINSSYDVVLVSSDGKQYKSHKIVLSSSSDFFYTILLDVPMETIPTILLPDADSTVIGCLLQFLHTGESSVRSSSLTEVLDMCQLLQIKGYSVLDVNNVSKGATDNLSDVIQHLDDVRSEEDEYTVEYLDCVDVDENNSDQTENEPEVRREMSELATQSGIQNETNAKSRNIHSEFDMALSELSKGKTIHQLSIEYNLPRSTLYQKFRNDESLKQNYRSERRYALDQAVRCVMEERQSLKKASDLFNLPKTAIWRELRKYHHYQPPSKAISQERKNAQNEILTGKSLTSISNKYGIPLTTLHRDKKRLSSEGKLPEMLRVRDRTENSDYGKRLEQALQKCRQGMSQYKAARIFNIPKATMWRYAHALFKVERENELSIKDEQYDVNFTSENESN